MITTSDLSFSYDNQAVFQFPNINCSASETLLITGNSGRGKTTLLHILAGLLKPKTGIITIANSDITMLSNKKLDHFRGKNIGLILQQSYFITSLSVLENIEMASWLANKLKATEKAKHLLSQLGLEDQINKHPSQLSLGQQQRVSIARALINEPKLLLADEPTSSLDDENAYTVAELLQKLTKTYDASLIIVTHDQRLKSKFKNQINLS